MTKQQVDTLKGVAILEVVVIHFISLFPEGYWFQYNVRSVLLVFIDQTCRMSIPLFIFLSWYGLSKKYKGQSVPPVEFLKSRIVKLIPLYLIWAIGIWVMMQVSPGWGFNMSIPLYLKILIGQADYHLYFVPLIVMLYFIFGFYSFLPRSARLVGTAIIGVVTLWWYSYLPTFRAGFTWIQPDQIQYLVPLTWLWYAWLGGVAADFNFSHHLSNRWIKRGLVLVTVVTAIWILKDAYYATHHGVWVPVLFAMEFTRWPVLAFATSVIMLLVSTVGHWGNEKGTLVSKVGLYSFFVFLAHTTFLRMIPAQILYPVPVQEWLFAGAIAGFLLLISSLFMA